MDYEPSVLAPRFWSKVDRKGADGCWLWTGATEPSGYGKLFCGRVEGRQQTVKVHRLSWEIAHATRVPDGQSVLHHCDVRPCVNPYHLYVGDRQDNARDRAERRRGKEHRQRGELNDNAKLTEDQVRAIIAELQRLPRRSQATIAADFGVKQPQISRIMLRRNWAHLWDG